MVCGIANNWRMRLRPSQGTAAVRKIKMSAKSQGMAIDENIFAGPEQGEVLLTLMDAPPYRF